MNSIHLGENADPGNNLRLLALTSCCVDYYPQLNQSFMGGNSLNQAAMWKKIEPEARVSVISCLGNNERGKMIKDFFIKMGIDHSRVYFRPGKTASNQLRVDQHGERFGIEGAWDGGVYESFLLSDDDWEWVAQQHIVAMPANNPNFDEMIRRKHSDQILSVDYLDVENRIDLEETLAFTDLAFVAAAPDQVAYLRDLAFHKDKLLVVTLGAAGSHVFLDNKSWHQPALPVPEVVDTTGCGDAYQAAFALTWWRTNNIDKAMYAGALAASEILQAWGGVGKIL